MALNAEVIESLAGISTQIDRVTAVVAEISAAAEQQAEGVAQVTQALEQMNGVTQQVAANAEESASAAEELSSQAATMNDIAGQFRLSGAGGPAAAPPGARPAAHPQPARRGVAAPTASALRPRPAVTAALRAGATGADDPTAFDEF